VPLDRVSLSETVAINQSLPASALRTPIEGLRWRGEVVVSKFWADDDVSRATPYEVTEPVSNVLLTSGANILWNLITGASSTHLDTTNARIAVGSSGTAAAAANTALGSEYTRVVVDSTGGVVVTGASVKFTATFSTAQANGAWLELALCSAASGGLINRLAQAAPGWGTKTSSAQWVAALTLSLS
jgi:hypothetical protein